MKRIILLLSTLIITALSACSADNTPSEETAISDEEVVDVEEEVPGMYTFQDETVQSAVEEYLDKDSEDMTEADLETLSKTLHFTFSGYVSCLDDIEVLFPHLRYLDIHLDEIEADQFYDLMNTLEDLKAVRVHASVRLDPDVFHDLDYIELSYSSDSADISDADNIPVADNLLTFSVTGKESIAGDIDFNVQKYIRVLADNRYYELFASGYIEAENGYGYFGKRTVVVSEETSSSYNILDVLDFSAEYGATIDNRMILVDVNFDGKKDILVDNGHFGAQGSVDYTCYISDGNQYIKSESFSDIPNPAVDSENEVILSTYRNWAASHSYTMYTCENGVFTETDRLTIEAGDSGDYDGIDKIPWFFIIEQAEDGILTETERYRDDEYTEDQILEIFYGEDSYWALDSDKWNTLYNQGFMTDFSIYGPDSVNEMIYQIIYEK